VPQPVDRLGFAGTPTRHRVILKLAGTSTRHPEICRPTRQSLVTARSAGPPTGACHRFRQLPLPGWSCQYSILESPICVDSRYLRHGTPIIQGCAHCIVTARPTRQHCFGPCGVTGHFQQFKSLCGIDQEVLARPSNINFCKRHLPRCSDAHSGDDLVRFSWVIVYHLGLRFP
jgi:hypothetical protein